MALTVVKYRKSATGEGTTTPTVLFKNKMPQQQSASNAKKPIIKLEGGAGLVINKIPASIKPAMKRSNVSATESPSKTPKYSLQTIASTGTPLTSFQWQQAIGGGGGGGGNAITQATGVKKQLSSLPPNTIIQTSGGYAMSNGGSVVNALSTHGTSVQIRRPTIYIKREVEKRTIRAITLELIEKNPQVHLGIPATRLPLIKNIVCPQTSVSLIDCYITLKKLRQNEDFSLLAEYFEMTEESVSQTFARSVVKLARYLRFLIRWSDSKKYYDRHKNLPFAFRPNLSHVQSLVECVDTEIKRPLQIDCSNYKFILSITPNGIISYVSEAFVGHNDDLSVMNACDFQSVIPKYLSLFAVPGKAIRRKRKSKHGHRGDVENMETDSTDSADESADDAIDHDEGEEDQAQMNKYTATRLSAELSSDQSLAVVNHELVSRKVKDFAIPTMPEPDPLCREQISYMLNCLREYKIMQPYAIKETLLYQYLNEIIVVCAALTNLQR